ncbi:MAG TPA: TetR/AcrR family transcriptional regulator [Marmoricola sp.]|nr:TetR/AcrR family transcriptional regulator [Marmoricola sp.]
MVSRHPDKLLKRGRRQQYSSATKRALVDVAERLFTEQGYAATSLDAIVAGARVTKGALYHHYTGKQALFEAVFEKVEGDAARRIKDALKGTRDPWAKALAGLRAFLDVVQDPAYQRVVIQEGPAILGYERFREQEERSSYAIVQDIVRSVLEAGTFDLDEAMIATFSRIFFGAMSAAGESVTSAEDPKVAVAQVETAITFILTGLRTLADSGVQLPDPGELLPAEDEELTGE